MDEGMIYVSFLDYEGNRKDYCNKCWEKTNKSITANGHFWRGKIPNKKDKIYPPDVKAMQLFRQSNDHRQKFVLALYLERKKQLIRRSQTLYENPETGEIFNIEKISLSEEEGRSIAQEINGRIN